MPLVKHRKVLERTKNLSFSFAPLGIQDLIAYTMRFERKKDTLLAPGTIIKTPRLLTVRFFKIVPAASYSPRVQRPKYHRRWRA